MKNITITLDERTAAWARRYAAARETSVSRLVGEILRSHMLAQDDYDAAMRRYLSKKPSKLKGRRTPYPARDDVHDRAGIR